MRPASSRTNLAPQGGRRSHPRRVILARPGGGIVGIVPQALLVQGTGGDDGGRLVEVVDDEAHMVQGQARLA